jgi:hypothetical protein
MEQLQQQLLSFKSVWVLLQENNQQMKESSADFDCRIKKLKERR